MAIPHTLKQALDLGHKELSADELERFKAIFGEARKVADCGTLNPGEKCAETACRDGYKIVMYCDGTNGCTRAVKVAC
ncbi:hypothetical protein [Dokdonella sp.]|uniref:hypothetical protein n=1 Tax=Dokdonella sp. TaxID=2291710 RepID=UPI003785120A